MATTVLTRRTVLKSAALATTALGMPFVHGAYAAGKLSCGFWDHWVPGANEPLAKLCREWADKEKVDLKIDSITTQGDKLNLTIAAEAQAKSGHDILQMGTRLIPHGGRAVKETSSPARDDHRSPRKRAMRQARRTGAVSRPADRDRHLRRQYRRAS